MAEATTITGAKVRVLLGNDANPVVYSVPCGFTGRSVTFEKTVNEIAVPDCADLDAAMWLLRDAQSRSISVSGEGVLASESIETWLDAWHEDTSVLARVEFVFPTKTVTYNGKMHVNNFAVTGQNRERVTATVEMASDGEMIKTVT